MSESKSSCLSMTIRSPLELTSFDLQYYFVVWVVINLVGQPSNILPPAPDLHPHLPPLALVQDLLSLHQLLVSRHGQRGSHKNQSNLIESIYLDFSISSIEESSELVNFLFELRLVLPALLSANLVGIIGDRVASL